MATGNANLEDMTDDELEAAQRAADGESQETNPAVGEEATTATAEGTATSTDTTTLNADAAAATAGADATVDTQAAKVEGIASKDGSRILPYAALQAERRAHRTANARYESAARELADAKQLIADLKAGKTPVEAVTEADVVQMEQDFPEHGKKMRDLFDKAQAFEASKQARQTTAEPEISDDPLQEAIDQIPLLVEWQANDPEKFARAADIDGVLKDSPKWRDKPVADRFMQATRMVADEYDIAFPELQASAKPKPSTAQQIASAAPRAAPNTLSDFKGGAVANHGTANVKNMSPTALLNRYESMSDAEIDAELARLG